jgi:autophagy-related protein 16
MASGGGDRVVRIWEPGSGVQMTSLHGMLDSITDLGFTSDQQHLLAAGSDRVLRMWALSSAREKHTLTGHSDKVEDPHPGEAQLTPLS